MKRINTNITAKQPTSPVLLIDVRVSIPCFQTPLEAGIKTKNFFLCSERFWHKSGNGICEKAYLIQVEA